MNQTEKLQNPSKEEGKAGTYVWIEVILTISWPVEYPSPICTYLFFESMYIVSIAFRLLFPFNSDLLFLVVMSAIENNLFNDNNETDEEM